MNKVIINKSYSNVVLFLEVIVYMEELNKLMENCESVLHIPNCSDVIDWKHDHIRCNERVAVNFINVSRATVWCF